VRNLVFALCALALAISSAIAEQKTPLEVREPAATAGAAVEIARAAAVARFGEAVIRGEEPLSAKLNERNNWIVRGRMQMGSLGGVVEVEIARRDGRVLRMLHEQ